MKCFRKIVLSIMILVNTITYSIDGGVWGIVCGWPGCIIGTLASCCCFKQCWDEVNEKHRKERIKRRYEQRGYGLRIGEMMGIMKHDHSTGEWDQTQGFKVFVEAHKNLPDPSRPKQCVQVVRQSSITGKSYIDYEYR